MDAKAHLQRRAALNPYRVLWDLQHTVDIKPTPIITHDAGSPRDQLSPFWKPVEPLTYLGWGKTTQLGYGLGLAMGAKLARPDKLCINVWGDAAIGFHRHGFRDRGARADPDHVDPAQQFLDGDRAEGDADFDGEISLDRHFRRLCRDGTRLRRLWRAHHPSPRTSCPAIKRGIQKTKEGIPVLLEFITSKETEVSRPGT